MRVTLYNESPRGQVRRTLTDWLFHVRRADMEHVQQVFEKLSLLLATLTLAAEITLILLSFQVEKRTAMRLRGPSFAKKLQKEGPTRPNASLSLLLL